MGEGTVCTTVHALIVDTNTLSHFRRAKTFLRLIKSLRDDAGFSLADIGRFMGRDHSTILTASGRFAARPHYERMEQVNEELSK